jgi:lysophospholipase L1-like esterase
MSAILHQGQQRCHRWIAVAILLVSVVNAANVAISPSNALINYSGRFDMSNPKQIRYDWSGVSMSYTFTGATNTSIQLSDHGNMYTVYINNKLYSILNTTNAVNYNYAVAQNLDPTQSYTVKLVKRNEALFGIVLLTGFNFEAPNPSKFSLLPTSAKEDNPVVNRIEFIGDSITCGYGDLGVDPCPFNQGTQNIEVDYAALTADALGAEYHIQCWSGKGVVRNYGEKTPTSPIPFPMIYKRTVANDANSTWNTAQWTPDVVVINLGTNDFSTQPTPEESVFVQGYINLINFVLGAYPDADVFAMCGPMIRYPCCMYVHEAVSNFGPQVHYVDSHVYGAHRGCSGHPDLNMHQKMAQVLTTAIETELKA